MYEKHFGFNTLPFGITPDPRFFYDNPSYREAMAALRYGIEGRKGFIVLTGEAGTGKTRLVKDLLQRTAVNIRTVFVTNPNLTVSKFFQTVLNDLGIASPTPDQGALTQQLRDYLYEQLAKQHIVALLVDEAQHLSSELLEELRLLSNLETNEDKLIQIVLVGQPELEERLDQPELRQLRQRVALRCRLVPLQDQEVSLYIQSRLQTAGFKEKALFDPQAVERIALYSNGIPRLINVICDSALLNCYALSKKEISVEIIEEVARDLQLFPRRPSVKLNANSHDAAKDEGNIIEETEPLTPVSRRSLAEEIQDVFIGEQRRTGIQRQWSLATLVFGFILGVLAAAGLGTIFYSQSTRDYLAEIAARIWAETNPRETVKTGAEALEALHEEPSKELKDVEPMASEKPLIPTQEPEESGVGASATPILEASETGPSQDVDALGRPQAKQTAKNEKNQGPIKPATDGASKNRVGDSKSARDRLEFNIHKAIAKHLIKGVEVSVTDGTVFLRGRVATENQKIAAVKAASKVPGVKYIRDQIIVNNDVAS